MAAHQTKAATALKKAAKTQYLPRISALGSYLNSNQQISLFGEDQHIPVYQYNAKWLGCFSRQPLASMVSFS